MDNATQIVELLTITDDTAGAWESLVALVQDQGQEYTALRAKWFFFDDSVGRPLAP